MADSVRISEWILRTDNRSAIRGLKEIADTGNSTTRSLKKDSEEQAASFRKVEESTSRLRDSFMGIAGMVGIGSVAFGLRDLKDSAVELQSSQAQLEASLRATGQEAGNTGEKLKAYAESMSTHGGFGAVENIQALTRFVSETHSATQAQSMLTLATNIARRTGQDLATTQTVVARAYTGSVGRLQQLLGPMVAAREAQVGLTVAHQKEIAVVQDQAAMMGKMGGVYLRNQAIAMHLTAQQQALAQMTDKHATAQQVLALATKEFAGSTASYSKTTAGQASNLKNSLHNLTEELGTALLPAMNWIIARGASLAQWMAKNKDVVLALVGAIGALGAAMGIREVIKSVHGLWTDVGKLAERFGIMGAAGEEAGAEVAAGGEAATVSWDTFFSATLIGIGIMALVEIATHWKQFEGLVVGVWNTVSGAVSGAWHWIEHTVSDGVTWIWNKIKWLGDEAKKLIADTPLGGLIGFGSNLLSGHIGHAFGDLAQGATGGIYQANSGTFGAPGRNLWESGSAHHHVEHHVNITPSAANFHVDGREIANATIRYALNRAARGPSNMVGGSLVTGSAGF